MTNYSEIVMLIMVISSGLCMFLCALCVVAVMYIAKQMTRQEHKRPGPYFQDVLTRNGSEWRSVVIPMILDGWKILSSDPGPFIKKDEKDYDYRVYHMMLEIKY